MEKTLLNLVIVAAFGISFFGVLQEARLFVLEKRIDRSFVNSILKSNLDPAGKPSPSAPANYKVQCKSSFIISDCDIVVDGDETIIPFSIQFDLFANVQNLNWGASALHSFPLDELEALTKKRLALNGASRIEFSRLLTWSPLFIDLEGRVQPTTGQPFHVNFEKDAFRWKVQALWQLVSHQ